MSYLQYLPVHTHFSYAGGPASPAEWCRYAAQLGYKTLAVADRAPMAAFPAFSHEARQTGISSMYGMEIDVLLPAEGKTPAMAQPAMLFACDGQGMSNLARVSSLAYALWPGVEEALSWEKLAECSDGLALILLGSNEAGALSSFTRVSAKKLEEWGALLLSSFADRAFVGLQYTGQPGDMASTEQVVFAANRMGLPLLATPTARYLDAEGAAAYKALKVARERSGWLKADAIDTPAALTIDESGTSFPRSPEEASAFFEQWPAAIENSIRIAEMCRMDSPVWIVEDGGKHSSSDRALRSLLEMGESRLSAQLGGDQLPEDMRERLQEELAVVETSGRWTAWLALSRIVEVSRSGEGEQRPVPLGAPLGMADGSLLAYALGLSPLDPMSYTRPVWLANGNSERTIALPGVEVPANRRDALLSALSREYGPGRIAHAACQTHITPVIALQAAVITLGMPIGSVQEWTARVLEEGWAALDEQEVSDPPPEISTQHPLSNPQSSALKALARALRGAPASFRPDPDALVLISRQDDSEKVRVPMLTNRRGVFGNWVPWSEDALCTLRLPAIVVQPSSQLAVVDRALSLAEQYATPDFRAAEADLAAFPTLDEAALSVITKGEVVGVPYLSAAIVKGMEGEITPPVLASLAARSLASTNYHPMPDTQQPDSWTSSTEDTDGVLVYKDQFAAIAAKVAGIPPGDANALRQAMIKPHVPGSKDMRVHFIAGCVASRLDGGQAEAIWNALAAAAPHLISRYAAAAWGRVAAWSAMLKGAHPAALLASTLTSKWGHDPSGVALLAEEAKRLHISVKPPDVNSSLTWPSLERDGTGWAITWGLALLPGWSKDAADKLISVRPRQAFNSLRDLCVAAVSAELSAAQLGTLIRSGACDHLGGVERNRGGLLAALPTAMEWAENSHADQERGQLDLFATASRVEPTQDDADTNAQMTPRGRYAQRSWEEQSLGVGFTIAAEIEMLRRALDGCGDLRSRLMTSAQISPAQLGQSIYLIGLLGYVEMHAQEAIVKHGSKVPADDAPMAVAWVEDLDGGVELVAFPPNYKRHIEHWTQDNLVIVTGRVSQHPDGELYLLCEHLAPYYGTDQEDELTLKIKGTRKQTVAPEVVKQEALTPAKETGQKAMQPQKAVPEPARASIAVVEAAPFTSATHPTYKLIITLPVSSDDHADIDTMIALNKLLEQHPGDDVVTLRIPYLPDMNAVTSAQLPRGVRYNSSLEAHIRNLLGYDSLATIKLVS